MKKKTKTKKRMTAKQLANLTPIKKGQVLNPEGGRAHNPLIKALRNLTIKEYSEVIELALTSNTKAIEDVIADPNTSLVQKGVAKAMLNAANNGHWNVINEIAERIVGVLPKKFELSGPGGGPIAHADQNMTDLLSDPTSFAALTALEEKLNPKGGKP